MEHGGGEFGAPIRRDLLGDGDGLCLNPLIFPSFLFSSDLISISFLFFSIKDALLVWKQLSSLCITRMHTTVLLSRVQKDK
jgi:hypothetical protein